MKLKDGDSIERLSKDVYDFLLRHIPYGAVVRASDLNPLIEAGYLAAMPSNKKGCKWRLELTDKARKEME